MDLFREQIYNSINRTFYHGSKQESIDSSMAKYNCFYITLNPLYAIGYAKILPNAEFDKVYKVKFKRKLNIFNPKAHNDIMRLIDLLSYVGNYLVKQNILKNIKERDWFTIFSGNEARDEVIKALKLAGYDGWFNYEYDKLMRKQSKINFYDLEKVSCIGIFNIDNLTIEEINFRELSEFKERREEDIEQLVVDANIFNHHGIIDLCGILVSFLKYNRKYLTFTEEELREWYRTFDITKETDDKMLEEAKRNHGFTGQVIRGEKIYLWHE